MSPDNRRTKKKNRYRKEKPRVCTRVIRRPDLPTTMQCHYMYIHNICRPSLIFFYIHIFLRTINHLGSVHYRVFFSVALYTYRFFFYYSDVISFKSFSLSHSRASLMFPVMETYTRKSVINRDVRAPMLVGRWRKNWFRPAVCTLYDYYTRIRKHNTYTLKGNACSKYIIKLFSTYIMYISAPIRVYTYDDDLHDKSSRLSAMNG